MPGVKEMGRPKKGARPASQANPSEDDRVAIIHLKGTVGYSTWLDGVHRKTHIPKAAIFRLAVAEWAERNGHPSPPEM